MTILAFVAGLIVGWNFIPQPAIVKDLVDAIKSKFGS